MRMVLEGQSGYPSQWAAIESAEAKVGVSSETLAGPRRFEVPGQLRSTSGLLGSCWHLPRSRSWALLCKKPWPQLDYFPGNRG